MNTVQLERFKLGALLGTGSDYEVHAAIDSRTGKPVVIKRPVPDLIIRKQYQDIDKLSEQLIEAHSKVGNSLPHISHLIGYSDATLHDDYFGDNLKQKYLVLVEERAVGLPMLADIADKFKGVPIGLSQNLFALYPLVPHPNNGFFPIHHQLMDVVEGFHKAGYLLLDMRPQNVFFNPKGGNITVIDIGTLLTKGRTLYRYEERDIHDFFLEMFKFYITPQNPPTNAGGYREPFGMRPILRYSTEIESMLLSFYRIGEAQVREAVITMLQKMRDRAYTSVEDFRSDLGHYLILLEEKIKNLPDLPRLITVWGEALEMLRADYWRKFLFDPDSDLAHYRVK